MATQKLIDELELQLERATTPAQYRVLIAKCDQHAKPLLIRRQHIENTLGDIQSLRIRAENASRRTA